MASYAHGPCQLWFFIMQFQEEVGAGIMLGNMGFVFALQMCVGMAAGKYDKHQ